VINAALPLSSPENGPHAHTRGVEASASATFATPWFPSLPARYLERIPKSIEEGQFQHRHFPRKLEGQAGADANIPELRGASCC
jgi:hypothetical protein